MPKNEKVTCFASLKCGESRHTFAPKVLLTNVGVLLTQPHLGPSIPRTIMRGDDFLYLSHPIYSFPSVDGPLQPRLPPLPPTSDPGFFGWGQLAHPTPIHFMQVEHNPSSGPPVCNQSGGLGGCPPPENPPPHTGGEGALAGGATSILTESHQFIRRTYTVLNGNQENVIMCVLCIL